MLESNNSFLLQELHKKGIIIEKLFGNIPSNSDKVKTVQHLSINQNNKKSNKKSNAGKNKVPRNKVIILDDSMVKGLNEYGTKY